MFNGLKQPGFGTVKKNITGLIMEYPHFIFL